MSKTKPKTDVAPINVNVDLPAIATSVNRIVEDTVFSVARAKVEIGKLLNEARGAFYTAKDFDDWRAKNTFITSTQDAYYCMQIASRFGDSEMLIKNTPFTLLKELVSAPPELVKTVEEKIAKGEELPSTREVQKAKAEAKPKEDKPAPAPVAPTPIGTPVPANTTNLKQLKKDREFLQMGLIQRIGHAGRDDDLKVRDRVEVAYLVFGLDPTPCVAPNPQTLEILYNAYKLEAPAEYHPELDECYDKLIDDALNF